MSKKRKPLLRLEPWLIISLMAFFLVAAVAGILINDRYYIVERNELRPHHSP